MAGQFGVVLTAALARGIGRRTNPERAELLRAICPFARGLKKLGRSDELKDSPAADVRPIPLYLKDGAVRGILIIAGIF